MDLGSGVQEVPWATDLQTSWITQLKWATWWAQSLRIPSLTVLMPTRGLRDPPLIFFLPNNRYQIFSNLKRILKSSFSEQHQAGVFSRALFSFQHGIFKASFTRLTSVTAAFFGARPEERREEHR